MFILSLFIAAKYWKQPQCPSTGEHQTVVHSYNGTLLSNKEEQTTETHNNISESPPLC